MESKKIKIDSLSKLVELTKYEPREFFIQLENGLASTKFIGFQKERGLFHIFNCVDGTMQKLKPHQLYNDKYSNIGRAICNQNFFLKQ